MRRHGAASAITGVAPAAPLLATSQQDVPISSPTCSLGRPGPGHFGAGSTAWWAARALRRGRRDAARLRVGDCLDFWGVEEIDPGRLLRLRAEMRLPGLAWLELRVDRDPAGGGTVFRQQALFHPRGLAGHLYWLGVSPFHAMVFGGIARDIAAEAEASAVRTS